MGDIHGRADLFDTLLGLIAQDHVKRGGSEALQIILLGDLVDRGPDSAGVVERALQLETASGNTRYLLGNHEEVFLKALGGDLKALAFFCKIGGRETILSYGISEEEYRAVDYSELLELLRTRVPPSHRAFLQRFEDLIVLGDYVFVHAGIRPGTSLAQQRSSDLRWIRDEFLGFFGPFEKIVVHGHTITSEVEIHPHRIGLDTGAYATGCLTAMGFQGTERWVLQTGA
ncbi:metallophosphoesterase [Sphingomonas sp. R-74633]|uniref:metallophosphoesterase n=1 Tax=Sphingomonas sp. R-74633 TaxID=2751188 RepID=UPI00359FD557